MAEKVASQHDAALGVPGAIAAGTLDPDAKVRIGEGLMIIAAGVYMVTTKNEFFHYDAFVYMFTASSGLIFSYLLYVSGLIPRFLAQLGLVGYITLAIGIPVTLMSTLQLDEGWGLIFVAVGAVFELVVPLLLIIKGFSIRKEEPRLGADHLSDPKERIAIPDLGLTGAAPRR